MGHLILVPGANHGGWWFAPLVEALAEHGHAATAVTLEGLDPDLPPAPAATLEDHVDVGTLVYVAAVEPEWLEQSPFVETTRRLRGDDVWRVVELPVTHNVLRTGVEPLLGVLLDVA